MIVGITGTTRGLASEQRTTLRRILAQLAAEAVDPELRHGDCVGVDQQAAGEARHLGYRIVGHPYADDDDRAYVVCDVVLPPSATHNRDIVEAVELLIGCPAADQEWPESGTWYTINCARERGVPVVVLSPSGRILDDTRAPRQSIAGE